MCSGGCHWNTHFFRLFVAVVEILCSGLSGYARLHQDKMHQICSDTVQYLGMHTQTASPSDVLVLCNTVTGVYSINEIILMFNFGHNSQLKPCDMLKSHVLHYRVYS